MFNVLHSNKLFWRKYHILAGAGVKWLINNMKDVNPYNTSHVANKYKFYSHCISAQAACPPVHLQTN